MFPDHPTSDTFIEGWYRQMKETDKQFGKDGSPGDEARIKSEIGYRLYEIRRARGNQLWEVAWKLGVTEESLALAEQGLLSTNDFTSILKEWAALFEINQDEMVWSVAQQIATHRQTQSLIKQFAKTRK